MTLVPVSTAVDTLELAPRAWDLAQKISRTEFVPTAMRGKPEAVLAAMLTGHEVGIGPMQALAKIDVIEGRPSIRAELMRALVLRAGHELWIEESTTTKCTVVGTRDGSSRETRVTWTMDDAKRAGLAGKQNWQKYPAAMLLARASAALVKAIFPDVLAGISYSSEELEDGDFIEAEAVDDDAPPAAPAKATRTRKAAKAITAQAKPAEPASTPAATREAPPLPGEADYEGQDQDLEGPKMPFPQYAAMRCASIGITDDDTRHGLWRAVSAGRVERAGELSDEEMVNGRGTIEGLARGTASLAVAGRGTDDEVWAVLEESGARRYSSRDLSDADAFTIVAGAHAAPSEAATSSSSDVIDVPPASEGGSGTPGPDASPRPSTPSEGGLTAPETEAAWRALMRERGIRLTDLARIALEVAPENSGVSVAKLVEDKELGALIFAKIIEAS